MKTRLQPPLIITSVVCIISILLLISCYSLSLQDRMNLWSSKLPFAYDEIFWPSYDFADEGARCFISAMQVPYGETRFSLSALSYFGKTEYQGEQFTDDTIFAFGVSLAPMLPTGRVLNDDAIIRAFLLARIWFDIQGIPVYFSEEHTIERCCFLVFATRDQIQKVTCNKLAALYIFPANSKIGVKEYYEKHA